MLDYVMLALQDSPTTGATPPAGPDTMTTMLIYGVGMIAIFYFMLIRPQRRETQRREQMLGALKKHDVVVTHSGLIGQIADIGPDVVTLKVDDNQNVRIRFRRQAIAGLLETPAGPSTDKKVANTDGQAEANESRTAGRASR
jgi:preprotein translocase subunit YajC